MAQAAIAVLAVYLAWRGNRVSHGNVFLERMVDHLLQVRGKANKVRQLYRALFDPCGDVGVKVSARTAWLHAREDVSVLVEQMVEAFPELEPVRKSWGEVEDEEDSHALGDALTCAAPNTPLARADRTFTRFQSQISETIRKLRSQLPGKGPLLPPSKST